MVFGKVLTPLPILLASLVIVATTTLRRAGRRGMSSA